MKPPLGVALSYAATIRAWLEQFQAHILETVLPGWERNRVAFGGQLASSQSKFDTSDFIGKKDRKSTRLNSSHIQKSRMPSSA